MIYSHPKKPLVKHLKNVYLNAKRKGFDSTILKFSCLYHDLGKSNPEFQKKLCNLPHGYANHGYLSIFLAWYIYMHEKEVREQYNFDPIDITIINNIISKHHGNLRNIDCVFSREKVDELEKFINTNVEIDFLNFVNENIEIGKIKGLKREGSFSKYKGVFEKFNNISCLDKWKPNALENFHKTQMNFSLLIEGDKRDASQNTDFLLDKLNSHKTILDNNLNVFLKNLRATSELNKVRTEIREASVEGLLEKLQTTNDRVFNLTAPTGSGKTFIMLKLANTIQQQKGDYGIILSLPFTSIIDQTFEVCKKDLLLDVLNYTSTANFSEEIKEKLNSEESEDIKDLIKLNFSEETFDHSFVLTTFVQLFETLISNKNSTLLKLPNFTKRIFLIDEIQSLPSNLYTFFVALLSNFCQKFDCYAILSTATMPNFTLNDKSESARRIFKNFISPTEILDSEKFYNNEVFNRYIVLNTGEKNIDGLVFDIEQETESVLIVANTVKDSLTIFNNVSTKGCCKYLLNRNFIPSHKIKIINEVKEKLKNNERVILVSTQLIEAGVDLDFPIVYRDLAPLSSIIQTAGRCNRNNKIKQGVVKVFKYYEINYKGLRDYRCGKIYNSFDLNFSFKNISQEGIVEKDFYQIQKKYYYSISKWKEIGKVLIKEQEKNLCTLIEQGKFEELGEYRLIGKTQEVVRLYVGDDKLWKEFKKKVQEKFENSTYEAFKLYKIQLSEILKRINNYTLEISLDKQGPYEEEIFNIRKINSNNYSQTTGLMVDDLNLDFSFC